MVLDAETALEGLLVFKIGDGLAVEPRADAWAFGFYFEIIDLFLEGFIHISDIGEDFYIFEEAKMRLKGTREGSTYSPGAKISVILQGIDLILRETKWYLVPDRTKSYKAKVKESKKSSPKRPVPKASSRQELIFGQKKAKKRRKK